jgi:hypothetical protein
MAVSRSRGIGPWSRALIALQVASGILLAAVAAGLMPWLAERPGLHRRLDISVGGRGSLDPAVLELLRNMPGPVSVELFLRVLDPPFTDVSLEVQGRLRELMLITRSAAPTKFSVVERDLSDIAAVQHRMHELSLAEAVNIVVVHCEGRRAVLRLFQDIAEIDPGNLDRRAYVPPRVASFRGEEALAEALQRVSIRSPERILFSVGHGERDLLGSEPRQLGRLYSALVEDGFALEPWDAQKDPQVPSDCRALAIIDPRQPFTAEERDAIRTYAESGGTLFLAPGPDAASGEGSLAEMLSMWRIELLPGVVCRPVVDPLTGQAQHGTDRCTYLVLGSENMSRTHPITEPLARFQRTLLLPYCGVLARDEASIERGVLLDVLKSPGQAWRDLLPHDFVRNRGEDGSGPQGFLVCTAAEMEPLSSFAGPAPAEGERPRTRVLVLACPDALASEVFDRNRDFLLNAFNWLCARDFRVSIRPRPQDEVILEDEQALASIGRLAIFGLPGACLAVGLLLAWRRRR